MTMTMNRAWSRVVSSNWAITDEALDNIDLIAQRINESPEVIATKLGRPLENTYDVELRDGVAIIPVVGPLIKYANYFSMISGATSYELIARDFSQAVSNDEVKAIVLNIDSPGGEANGVSELADIIYQARGSKPVIAYVSGMAASGGYWIAAAADKIIMSDISQVGSIGAILSYERKNKKDVERVRIVSRQTPYKALDPATDEGRSRYEDKLTQLADIFISKIALYRGVSSETVQNEFGQGDTFMGVSGVEAGLADEIGTFESTVQSLVHNTSIGGFLVTDEGESLMAETKSTSSAKAKQTPVETNAPVVSVEFIAENHPDIAAHFRSEGAKVASDRIQGIITSEAAETRQATAMKMAFGTSLSVEDALGVLETVPSEQVKAEGNPFAAAMKAQGNPSVGPDDSTPKAAVSVWDKI